MDLRDKAEEAVRDIITTIEREDAGRPDEAKIADLYASFMDEDAIEAAGAAAAVPAARRDRRGQPTRRAHPAARAVRPRGGQRAGRRGHRVRSRQSQPLRDVRRPGRHRAAGRGVLPAGRATPRSAAQYRDHIGRSFELAGVERPRRPGRSGSSTWRPTIAATHWDKVQLPRPAADVQPDAAGRVRRQPPRPALADVPGRRRDRRVGDERARGRCSRRSSARCRPCSPRTGCRPGRPGRSGG